MWELTSDRPIYTQLLEQLQLAIVSGRYRPGERLPSVRDLAAEASVNPNTMQRALSELEGQGLIQTQRTSGKYVTDDQEKIMAVKKELATQQLEAFLTAMKKLGYTREEVSEFLSNLLSKGELE